MRKNGEFGKISKIWKNTKISENTPKIRKKSEDLFLRFHKNLVKKLGKILKIWKNTPKIRNNTTKNPKNTKKSEKYFKNLEIWKNTPEN